LNQIFKFAHLHVNPNLYDLLTYVEFDLLLIVQPILFHSIVGVKHKLTQKSTTNVVHMTCALY